MGEVLQFRLAPEPMDGIHGREAIRQAWNAAKEQQQVLQFPARQPKVVEFSEEVSRGARRGLYFALDGMLSGLAANGSKRCKTVVMAADRGLARPLAEATPHSGAAAEELRTVLRARCELCPTPCGAMQ